LQVFDTPKFIKSAFIKKIEKMKKLIYGGFFLTIVGITSCQKKELIPSPEDTQIGDSYNQNDVNSILKAAGITNITTQEKAGPGVKVVAGKWDGNMNSTNIGCLPGNICYIEITAQKSKTNIIIPTENVPTKIIGRTLPGEWETTDVNGVKTTHYPYEEL
jgi:hypothetical protein